MIAPLDLPASNDNIAGFSLHPDGKRLLTSIAKWPFDIWMLEGWACMPKDMAWPRVPRPRRMGHLKYECFSETRATGISSVTISPEGLRNSTQ